MASLEISGSIFIAGSITGSFTGSLVGRLHGTASYSTTASYWSGSIENVASASYAATASYWSGSIVNAQTASFAVSASWAPGGAAAFPFTGSAGVLGALSVNGDITGSSLRVENNTHLDGQLRVTNDAKFDTHITIEGGNPNLKLRDTSGGGFSSGYDLRVNTGSLELYDDTHNRNVLSDFFNTTSSKHTTSLTSEIIVISGSDSVTVLGQLVAANVNLTGSLEGTASLSNETMGAGDPNNNIGGEIQFRGGFGPGSPNGKNTWSSAFTLNPYNGGLNIGDPNTTGGNGLYYLATGYDSVANGNYSVSFGSSSYANGEGAFTHGKGVIAGGGYSHAEGSNTLAEGYASHAEGESTIASGSHQHVQGQYNLASSVPGAFIVGNGINDLSRSNLIHAAGDTVEITGSLNVSGSLTATSITGSLLGTATSASFAVTSSTNTLAYGFYNFASHPTTNGDMTPTQQIADGITLSGNTITIQNAGLYKFEAFLALRGDFAEYAWVDSNNVALSGVINGTVSSVNSGDPGTITPAMGIAQIAANTIVKIRIVNAGGLTTNSPAFSKAMITQLR